MVVDPAIASLSSSDEQGEDGIVAVAGDARFCAEGIDETVDGSSSGYEPNCEGGPECHAVMRVVEMIAIQRRSEGTSTSEHSELHKPELSPLEKQYLYQPSSSPPSEPTTEPTTSTTTSTTRILPRSAGGYLCTDLDIYMTHEPCLSCSMGILLSRFRAVTFLRRGRLVTGGLASEPTITTTATTTAEPSTEINDNNKLTPRENYYGLFWRKELNWRAMCFEFVEDDEGEIKAEEGWEEPGEYHA